MSNQPQYNKSNSNANGNNSNTNSNSNNYQKSMDDWLSNNIVNNNNNNNHSTANNNNNHDAGGYQQKNLDDWLNATMKDSPKTFSVSSTEFLDGPPTRNVLNSNGIGSIAPPVNLFRAVPDFAQVRKNKAMSFFVGDGNRKYFIVVFNHAFVFCRAKVAFRLSTRFRSRHIYRHRTLYRQ